MSSADEFDDSLDELLANITSSQLDPSLRRQTEDKQKSNSCETQTETSFEDILNNTLKRKICIVETDKHHHKPCVYHSDNISQIAETQNKRFKCESTQIDGNESDFSDINDENEIKQNQSITQSKSSSQTILITNEDLDNWSQTQTDVITERPESPNLVSTQYSIPLFGDSFEESSDSESDRNDMSFPLFETDDELQRSPLIELDSNGLNERPVLRPSQEVLFKTQNSQNSNSSQNSSIFSF